MRTAERRAVLGLKGVRVFDCTWAGAGPYATEQLAQMGADVVKVETASRPDLLRVANVAYNWAEGGGIETNPCFNDINAGKRSIALDLKTPAGRETALRLALEADIVCDNMRPGKMAALGLGHARLRALKPSLICGSVSATGRVPGAGQDDVAGYAPVFWAEGGGASVTGYADGLPAYLRAPVDMNAATFFVLGILSALVARRRTGIGAHVDCSAVETVSACIGDEVLAASLGLPAGGLRGNDRPPFAPNEVLPCAGDDRWIAVSVETEAQWLALCDELGAEALRADPSLRGRLGRWQARAVLRDALAVFTRTRDALDLEVALQRAGVAASMSNPLRVLIDDPALRRRGFWKTVRHPLLGDQAVGGLPWTMDPPLDDDARGGPLLGQHTAEVMREWLRAEDTELRSLAAAGAFERCELGLDAPLVESLGATGR